MLFTQHKQDRRQNSRHPGRGPAVVETTRSAPAVGVEFSAHVDELAEVARMTGTASSGAMLTRCLRPVVAADKPVWFWLDTDELAFEGRPVPVVSVLNNVLRERTRLGRETHLRTVTRSVVDGMNDLVERGTRYARGVVGIGSADVVPEELVAAYGRERVRYVQEAVRDNEVTEKLLFAWEKAFVEGAFIGSVEFRGVASPAGTDYVMVGVGAEARVLEEWVIVRSERCRDTAPFSGVGVTVDPWGLAGTEVERKMSERWHEAVESPPAVHTESFVRTCVASWDQARARVDHEVVQGMRVAPRLVADIDDVCSFDAFS